MSRQTIDVLFDKPHPASHANSIVRNSWCVNATFDRSMFVRSPDGMFVDRELFFGSSRAGPKFRFAVLVKPANMPAKVSMRVNFPFQLGNDLFAIGEKILDDLHDLFDFIIKHRVVFDQQVIAQPFAHGHQRNDHGHEHNKSVPDGQSESQRTSKIDKPLPVGIHNVTRTEETSS